MIKVEAGLFVKELYSEIATRASAEAGRFCITEYPGLSAISDFVQSETRIIDAEKHGEAVERARAAREIAEGEASELGAAFMRDAAGPDAFSKLSRYEARIEKSLFQTLAALHTLQTERRRGQDLRVTPIGALPAVGDACAANDEAAA